MALEEQWPGEVWRGVGMCPKCNQRPGMPHDCARPATYAEYLRLKGKRETISVKLDAELVGRLRRLTHSDPEEPLEKAIERACDTLVDVESQHSY